MKSTFTRKRLLLSLGAAAVAAAAIAFAVVAFQPRAESTAEVNPLVFSLPPTVPVLAPADADTVVVAPYSPDWWKKVASMAPSQTGLFKVDLASAGTQVLRLGYSRSPDTTDYEVPNTGPLRLVYLETGSAEDAAALAGWLKEQPRYDNRRVHIQDRTVIVGQSWNTNYSVPEKTISAVPGYKSGYGASQGSMWMNIDQEVVSLAVAKDPKTREVYSAVMTSALGFKPGTTWVGISDNGDTWKGDFRSGGVDREQIDFQEARDVLTGAEKVLLEAKDGMTTTRFVEPGAAGIMNGASVTSGTSKMGGAGYKGSVAEVEDQAVLLVHDVTQWNSALSGNYTGIEAIGQRTLSANEKTMTVGFTYRDPDKTGPAGQSAAAISK
jgi:hypothetical protein